MRTAYLVCLLVGIAFVSGCVNLKDVTLTPSILKAGEEATLRVDIENTDATPFNGSLVFTKPEAVTIKRDGNPVTSVQVYIGKDETWGAHVFTVTGQHVAGQPESPWTITISVVALNGEIRHTDTKTLTVVP